MAGLTDAELQARTALFRAELGEGKKLDDLLVPAFATVREAAKRVLGQRHFDVQLIGGMVLHESGIAEMRPAKARPSSRRSPAISMRSRARASHVITVNDYLARRDAEWMGRVYNSSASASASSSTVWKTRTAPRITLPTSPMARTTNSASTICATI